MSLERAPSALPGVRYGAVARNEDSRGSFRELWRANAFGAIDPGDAGAAPDTRPTFIQANLSTSAVGVLRGLHCHERQLDYWVVASGRAFVALVDIRPMLVGRALSPSVETRVLAADDWVVIPTGVAHGFLALESLGLLYLVTNAYDGTDELGFAWDDPAVGVPWPSVPGTADGRPILSERDQSNPSLADLLVRLRHTAD
jgi:dTDP-4-dehydrorhamnose 3,5-epimerase